MGAFNWFKNEMFDTFKSQMSTNPAQEIVVVTILGQEDALLKEFRSQVGGGIQIMDVSGLSSLKTGSQHLIIVYPRHTDLNNLLGESLRVLREDGSLIVCDYMDNFSTKEISDLSAFFDSYGCKVEGDNRFFKLYCMNQFEDTVQNKLGLYWILEAFTNNSTSSSESDGMTRSFLDQTQYTEENINAYEWIFGKDFISPGGIDENRRILSEFDELAEGKKMLDIGCGIGGSPRQVSQELQMEVLGVDISSNMIAFAIERAEKNPDKRVRYQLSDAVEYKFKKESFDYVYSRDCVQHISELARLFRNIYECLKPGGQVQISMYGKGKGELTDEFLQYVKDRKYTLRTLEEVIQMAKDAGFGHVEGRNMTKRFEEILHKERQKAVDNRDVFMERFSVKKYDALLDGWEQKLRFIGHDNHNWFKIKCTK